MQEQPLIGVFYYKKSGDAWQHLPETSLYLIENGLNPNVGDRISAIGEDYEKFKPNTLESVMVVKEKIFGYSLSKIALVCTYEPF